MNISRCCDQKDVSLLEFYQGLLDGGDQSKGIGEFMIALLNKLIELEDPRSFYGLTSHSRLVLLAENSYRSPWFVTVSTDGIGTYRIETLMPESKELGDAGSEINESHNLDDTVKKILTAIEKSKGWHCDRK